MIYFFSTPRPPCLKPKRRLGADNRQQRERKNKAILTRDGYMQMLFHTWTISAGNHKAIRNALKEREYHRVFKKTSTEFYTPM